MESDQMLTKFRKAVVPEMKPADIGKVLAWLMAFGIAWTTLGKPGLAAVGIEVTLPTDRIVMNTSKIRCLERRLEHMEGQLTIIVRAVDPVAAKELEKNAKILQRVH